jgi:hypothetical protein
VCVGRDREGERETEKERSRERRGTFYRKRGKE